MERGTQVAEPAQAADLWRFFSYVEEQPNGCWQWIGGRLPNGYGQFHCHSYGKRNWRPHVWIMHVIHGPLPDGLTHDHLCRNVGCCNPAHLERVTNAENQRRRKPFHRHPTVCKNGHPFDAANTRIAVCPDGTFRQIVCRTCQRRWINEFKTRRKVASDVAC